MSGSQKILICGDVKGNFKTLFNRVENLNKKSGPFDLLLCVGDFFGDAKQEIDPYISGTKQVTVPTYILGPNSTEQIKYYSDLNGCEICPNITYLGKKGLYKTSCGLKIAYLSGLESTEKTTEPFNFNDSDVTSLRDVCVRGTNDFRGIDILATSQWPKDITNLDETATINTNYAGSGMLSWLAVQLKPRYHVSALESVYFERKPYRNRSNVGDTFELATRFIALADVGNKTKQKWLYAVNLTPVSSMTITELQQQTTDETECPFPQSLLNKSVTDKCDTRGVQFFYDMTSQSDQSQKRRKNRNDFDGVKRQRPVFDQAKCWFCLGSPEVEKHLIISIGTECYLALAKGAMVKDHLLILPVTHHQSTNGLSVEIHKEINQFKIALSKYFSQHDKVPVFFERNYKTSHLQVQVVPIPTKATRELKEIFKDEAEGHGFQLNELPEDKQLEDLVPPGAPYFYTELPSGEALYTRIKSNFPLQFGREVLASGPILDMPERVEWQDCKISKTEEENIVQEFRTAFAPFDFTL